MHKTERRLSENLLLTRLLEIKSSIFRPDSLSDKERANLEKSAKIIAEGGIILWDRYSPGLAIDGTNPEAVAKLRKIKKIPEGRMQRPFVSTVSLNDIHLLIDETKHFYHLKSRKHLASPNDDIFIRFHAHSLLQPPIALFEDNKKTVVVLIHTDARLNYLYDMSCRYKKKSDKSLQFNFLRSFSDYAIITGSSANATHENSPNYLDEVSKEILSAVDGILDFPHMRNKQRGRIPIIDLTEKAPILLRDGIINVENVIQKLTLLK